MPTIEIILFVVFNLLQLVIQSLTAKGCFTYVPDADNPVRHSMCVREDTNFSQIPRSLPKEATKLTINFQKIHVLDGMQLQHLPNLTYLNLDSNELTIIRNDAFQFVPLLRTLSLCDNRLSLTVQSFHPGSLIGIKYLEDLNLMRNPIGRVPAHFFYPMRKSLKSLVLAGASSEFNLTLEALEGLFEMEFLDISYNNLQSIHESFSGLFATMRLRKLYLFGNPWRCDCSLKWLRQWAVEHNSTQFYMDLRPADVDQLIAGNDAIRLTTLTTEHIDQPKCKSPAHLEGRAFFPIKGVTNNPVSLFEMACPPKPVTKSVNIRGMIGENLTLTCEFEASTVDEVFWYKNGHPLLLTHNIRVRQVSTNQLYVDLVFHKLQYSDVGTYVCLIKNGFGKANNTMSLTLSDLSWLYGTQSDSNSPIGEWISKFDTKVVLKYTSLIAIGLVLVLIIVGLLVYCFIGCPQNRFKHLLAVPSKSKANTGIGRSQTKEGTTSAEQCADGTSLVGKSGVILQRNGSIQPCVLTFQDNHPLYGVTDTGEKDADHTNCPIHGQMSGVSPFDAVDKSYAQFEELELDDYMATSGTLQRSQVRKSSDVYQCSDFGIKLLPIGEQAPTKINSSDTVRGRSADNAKSSVMVVESVPITSPRTCEYLPCPKHGNVLASLSPSLPGNSDVNARPSVPDDTLKRITTSTQPSTISISTVRSVQAIQLSTAYSRIPNSYSTFECSKSALLKNCSKPTSTSKHVEFVDGCKQVDADEPGFITTV